ncbi:DUF1266 domain-containing protein [Paenibacillus sp. D2_2]|uniref:DUF1266 domain-containing protein n=1 Tax=Paenibacillus sp. D2_2 TaxID=3073092 RepID=UPI0028152177|nr:DUF1266 domain-containing protein [Paenibacillus sp. D2_2]WMT43354.1 DUF1266 domain-containing protein [Paenibacillus sp. D2_2]
MNNLLSSSQLWALAAGDILLNANGYVFANEYAPDKGSRNIDDIKDVLLGEGWSIVDEESAYDTLNSLSEIGHREDFNQTREIVRFMTTKQQDLYIASLKDEYKTINARIVQRYDKLLPESGILAWDLGRAASICHFCAEVGYFSREYAWSYLLNNANQIQQSYSNWIEYGLAYIIGRQFWQKELDDSSTSMHLQFIKRQLTDTNCPWSFLPWNTKLETNPLY